jgi:predicted PolB exonuclease-like 3'-5' exonuclease
MTVTMIYDLETVPDLSLGKRLLKNQAEDLDDQGVLEALLSRKASGSTTAFLPLYLQKIIAISVVVSTPEWVKVWSLGDLQSEEPELIMRFYEGLERYTPQLVSWNGSGFDLPVLQYRSLLHGVACARYWDTGEQDQRFKWNNYRARYHTRHTDLMDVLANYQSRAYAPLDDIAVLLGFPGKMGMDGGAVFESYQSGQLQNIRHYCETDVLNTYLVFLRFQYIQGQMDADHLQWEEERLKAYLSNSGKEHYVDFLNGWFMNTVQS